MSWHHYQHQCQCCCWCWYHRVVASNITTALLPTTWFHCWHCIMVSLQASPLLCHCQHHNHCQHQHQNVAVTIIVTALSPALASLHYYQFQHHYIITNCSISVDVSFTDVGVTVLATQYCCNCQHHGAITGINVTVLLLVLASSYDGKYHDIIAGIRIIAGIGIMASLPALASQCYCSVTTMASLPVVVPWLQHDFQNQCYAITVSIICVVITISSSRLVQQLHCQHSHHRVYTILFPVSATLPH